MKVELTLPKEASEKLSKVLDAVTSMLQTQTATQMNYMSSRPVAYASPPSLGDLEPPTEKEKETVEVWLKEMDSVIEKEAISVVKGEIRNLMLMGGNIKAIASALKKGQKPKLVRKKEGRKDPLFIQIGNGVEEPIEEFYLFG